MNTTSVKVIFIISSLLLLITPCHSKSNIIPRSDATAFRNNINNYGMMSRSIMISSAAYLAGTRSAEAISSTPSNLYSSCECKNPVKCLCQKEYNPQNERIYDTARRSFLPAAAAKKLTSELAGRKVVVIGEVHSNPCHHHCEFEVLRALADSNNNDVVIGLECFYRQHQNALDRYVFEHKNIGTLKEETKWDTSWGYDLNYYAKLFQFAKARGIRLLGLNIPYPVAQYVGQEGLDALPDKMKGLIPAIDVDDKVHKDQFMNLIGAGSGGHGGERSDQLERMYQVQCLWEEYMSQSAADYIQKNPQTIVCVIAGLGHIVGRRGIPDRIKKKVSGDINPFVIVPQQVDWSVETGLPNIDAPLTVEECDWAWYTESAEST